MQLTLLLNLERKRQFHYGSIPAACFGTSNSVNRFIYIATSVYSLFLEIIIFLETWSTRNYYVRDSSSTNSCSSFPFSYKAGKWLATCQHDIELKYQQKMRIKNPIILTKDIKILEKSFALQVLCKLPKAEF